MNARSADRRGVSLLEVLIGIFVLAIGILSVASLIPLAQSQVLKATIADRVAALGQNSHDDARIRGFYKTFRDGADDYTMFVAQNGVTDFKVSDLQNRAVAIDPLGLTSTFASSAALFPHTIDNDSVPSPIGPQMDRVNIKLNATLASTGLTKALVDALFYSKDELTFGLPDDPELRPTGGFNTAATRRAYDPRYSYLITLVPASGNQVNATYVMFRNRDITGLTDENGLNLEHAVEVVNYSKGDSHVTLKSSSRPLLDRIRRDDWVMLGGFDRSGNEIFRWYRVRFAEESVAAGSDFNRVIDLGATDWDVNPDTASEKNCTLIPDVVGVYERTVRFGGEN